MPQKYMCNSCKAVVYHLNKEMGIKHPKKRDWKESELLDVYDDICAQDTFEGYGIKLLNGKNERGVLWNPRVPFGSVFSEIWICCHGGSFCWNGQVKKQWQ